MPSAPLNGFHPDPAPQGSTSPSTVDAEEPNQGFDVSSILRPTPTKPGGLTCCISALHSYRQFISPRQNRVSVLLYVHPVRSDGTCGVRATHNGSS